MKPMGQLARVVAEFLETTAREMPPEEAEVLLRSARLLRDPKGIQTIIAERVEPQEEKAEPDRVPAQGEGVKVLDELLGRMLTDADAIDKIVTAVSERQRHVRENGLVPGDARVELTFSRPAGQKIGIAISENLDREELEKDLSAAHRLGFDCVAGYAC